MVTQAPSLCGSYGWGLLLVAMRGVAFTAGSGSSSVVSVSFLAGASSSLACQRDTDQKDAKS